MKYIPLSLKDAEYVEEVLERPEIKQAIRDDNLDLVFGRIEYPSILNRYLVTKCDIQSLNYVHEIAPELFMYYPYKLGIVDLSEMLYVANGGFYGSELLKLVIRKDNSLHSLGEAAFSYCVIDTLDVYLGNSCKYDKDLFAETEVSEDSRIVVDMYDVPESLLNGFKGKLTTVELTNNVYSVHDGALRDAEIGVIKIDNPGIKLHQNAVVGSRITTLDYNGTKEQLRNNITIQKLIYHCYNVLCTDGSYKKVILC